MIEWKVESNDLISRGITQMRVYEVHDLDKLIGDISGTSIKKIKYNKTDFISDRIITFDIETNTVPWRDSYAAYMYIWQAAILDRDHVIMGSTWSDWIKVTRALRDHFGSIVPCYVHNLGYEAQFLRNYHHIEECFAVDNRTPVRLLNSDEIEYRCSWKLSNMSLAKFCEKSNVMYQKLGNYDYDRIRLPGEVSIADREYCYCDVAGLIEAVNKRLETHTTKTIPLTSTGYVRDRMRQSLANNSKKNRAYFKRTELNEDTYNLCKKARRGGNTHANAYYTGKIIDNVRSRDKKSSYPYEMMTKKYPMRLRMESPSEFDWHMERGRAIVFEAAFEGLRLRNELCAVPYLSSAKCSIIKGGNYYKKEGRRGKGKLITDNGRIISAGIAVMAITEVDYQIIQSQYTWDKMHILQMAVAEKEYLPADFRKTIMEYFAEKEALTGVDEYMRDRKKNETNGIFGMLLTDIVHDKWLYQESGAEAYVKEQGNIADELVRYYKSFKNFAAYQQGIYVTAYARQSLQEGLDVTGIDTIYTDTDSDKYIGEHEAEFEAINDRIRSEADNFDVKPYLPSGEYLGVWEVEGTYEQFATAGAKKYGYIKNGKLEVTIAGCNKKKGSAFFAENWGLDAFKKENFGKVVVDAGHSGRMTAYYNDLDKTETIMVRGQEIEIGSNIAMVPATYTLGITDVYDSLITSIQKKYDYL